MIFHLHDEERALTAISNMINLIKDLGEENVDIELLVNGSGVKMMLKNSEYIRKIDYLLKKNVNFRVCSNSLEGYEISEDELIDGAVVVPSGVGELIKKQEKGWNYIKI